jgi:membrane fusion protein, copper/silver efflux system
MKRNLKNKGGLRFIIAIMFVSALMSCTHSDSAQENDSYTCPMHPTVNSDRPGTCPVCGMDLVRKARPGENVKITEDLSRLIKSPNETVVASVKSVKGQYKSIAVAIPAKGIVTYDTRKIFTIPARISGRVEKVYLKYTFQRINKGDRVAEIYSPEMIAAQRELLFVTENDPANHALVGGAKKKLELLGMSSAQISELIQSKEAKSSFTLYSPHSGYLATGQQAPSTSEVTPSASPAGNAMSNDGMGAAPQAASVQQGGQVSSYGSLIREGQYVTAGQTMFTIVNNNAMRIELNLAGSVSENIKEGTSVDVDFGNERTTKATVDFVQPFFAQGETFVKVRLNTNETDGLHIGHLVDARIRLDSAEGLWVPKEAVLDLGLQKVVFLKERGIFKPSEVVTGVSAEGLIEIKKGLASSDEIAANAHYLIDSESFVKPSE